MQAHLQSHIMAPISEIAFVGLSLISLASSGALLGDATALPPMEQAALQWLLLPLIGALFSSVCAMLLNPRPEARKMVLARSIFGVAIGTAIPKILSVVHPSLVSLSLDPAIAFMSGFFVCMGAYIIARPFVEKLYARSGDIAEDLANGVESRIKREVSSRMNTTTTTTVSHPTFDPTDESGVK